MSKSLFFVVVLLLPSLARAGGFEVYEQSPAGVGTAGAQAAESDDPGAIFYNPARMTYQKGTGLLGGVNIINSTTHATAPPGMGKSADSTLTTAAPTLYGVIRIGSRFAIGLGGFSNMAEIFTWPGTSDFGGRFLGYQINLTTLTLNPSVAFRPLPWLALGFGLDIVPASFEVHQSLSFGAAEGRVHASGTATGVGGNAGLFIRVVPRWLDFAFTYRSAIALDFDGKASLDVPPELAALAASFQNAKTSVTLPHNFTFAIGSHLLPHLTMDLDAHLTLWDALKSLTLTLTDPHAAPGTPPTVSGQPLDFRISYGLRLGFELRVLEEKLRIRLGGGYERTPVPNHTLGPLSADGDRGMVSVGLGYHAGAMGVDLAYLAVILPQRTSTNPEYRASYDSIGHVISIGLTLRFDDFPSRLNEPAYKH